MVTRGFTGRGSGGDHSNRIPPGQHLVENFPVLTAGPTPRIETSDWKFTVKIGPRPIKVWNWGEFNALPKTKVTKDIHCVTSWSKLDTAWEGVLIEDILAAAGVERNALNLTLPYRTYANVACFGAVVGSFCLAGCGIDCGPWRPGYRAMPPMPERCRAGTRRGWA